jgi:class 3 adenylate cyclase
MQVRVNFPRSIANRLMGSWSGAGVELTRPSVSLFFSDIVGFTHISSTMTPAKVSDMLGRLFRRMDGCARFHGLERVDVIGDAYIACCNFTEPHEDDHAVRCATFAVAVMRAAQSTLVDEEDPALGHVKLRIGLHVGPVAGKMLVRLLLCLRRLWLANDSPWAGLQIHDFWRRC